MTRLDPKLVVIDFCNANRHRSVASGTIMSAMCLEKGIDHGLLHLSDKDNWKYMCCGGACPSCGEVDSARANGMAKRAFDGFKAASDSSYNQQQPFSVTWTQERYDRAKVLYSSRGPPALLFQGQVGRIFSWPPPTSAAPTNTLTGPCGTTKTTNKVPGVVKVEDDDEVPDKDPKGFQTLKLSAQPTAATTAQPVVGSTAAPTVVKHKAMPTTRDDTPAGVSGPTQWIH